MPRDDFEPVHVELDWYDGIRSGIAAVDGVPHYFRSENFTDLIDEGAYLVWPADDEVLALEREQSAIYFAAQARGDRHPGEGGVDARYDELELLLEPRREPPPDARRLFAQWRHAPNPHQPDHGGGYWVRWRTTA
ncbi:hypothetical protein [Asanoa iriomotensis]|uniref:DUF2442 domain-containing protein n=1 Tax=Asanoa iriomotensis TaxID=234613 RepID=A0ABQ4CE99_9ACTN|nr:hypothetical protein [Asanoa iriomotensis]GIF61097.1 hypothetical protein Air01nite_71920 [Asanoa iriomotensis]